MKPNEDPLLVLEKIKKIAGNPKSSIYNSNLWELCHDLAEQQYPPAKDFFVLELNDPRFDWRREAIALLGFHYPVTNKLLNKFREMAENDIDDSVRLAAVGVVGTKGKLPEPVLLRALMQKDDPIVIEAAFNGLLRLSGLSYNLRGQIMKDVRGGKIKATREELIEILKKENKTDALNSLDS